jgi:hypothetical protein
MTFRAEDCDVKERSGFTTERGQQRMAFAMPPSQLTSLKTGDLLSHSGSTISLPPEAVLWERNTLPDTNSPSRTRRSPASDGVSTPAHRQGADTPSVVPGTPGVPCFARKGRTVPRVASTISHNTRPLTRANILPSFARPGPFDFAQGRLAKAAVPIQPNPFLHKRFSCNRSCSRSSCIYSNSRCAP